MNPETGIHQALTVYPNFILYISVYLVCFHFKFAHWSIVCMYFYLPSFILYIKIIPLLCKIQTITSTKINIKTKQHCYMEDIKTGYEFYSKVIVLIV